MRSVKEVIRKKQLPRRGEKGFTLVELLIVLAILAVLAAVVIPSVTGMFGRGAEQALDTDRRTVQTAVATYFFDVHDGIPWEDDDSTDGHYYPTGDGKVASAAGVPITIDVLVAAAGADPDYFSVGGAGEFGQGCIWMGLLVNTAGTGADPATAELGAPLDGEKGPYLQEFPKSCSENNGTPNSPAGTYTWVVVKEAKVYALYWDDTATLWVEGSAGTYP